MRNINVLFKLNLLIQLKADINIKNYMFAMTGVPAQSRGFSIVIAQLDKLSYNVYITRCVQYLLVGYKKPPVLTI